MGVGVELAVKLAHRDGLGIEHVYVHWHKRLAAWLLFALQTRTRQLQDLIALRELRDMIREII